MAEKTVFRSIIDGEIPADIVYQDDHCLAFRDIHPQAPIHVLVIPKREIASVATITAEDAELIGHLWLVIRDLAEQLGIAKSGYRVVVNNGDDGGQDVPHLHYHLLGGRQLHWPPG